MPKCPRCGFIAKALYKCDVCGDIRCCGNKVEGNKGMCSTSKGPGGKPNGAIPNGHCKACKKGTYRKI